MICTLSIIGAVAGGFGLGMWAHARMTRALFDPARMAAAWRNDVLEQAAAVARPAGTGAEAEARIRDLMARHLS